VRLRLLFAMASGLHLTAAKSMIPLLLLCPAARFPGLMLLRGLPPILAEAALPETIHEEQVPREIGNRLYKSRC